MNLSATRRPSVAMEPVPLRWGQGMAGCGAAGLMAGAMASITAMSSLWVLTGVLIVGTAAVGVFGWRTNHRRQRSATALVMSRQELFTLTPLTWTVVWQGWPGRVRRLRVRFQSNAATLATPFRAQLTAAINTGWGESFTVDRFDAAKGRAQFRAAEAEDPHEQKPAQALVDRLEQVTAQVFGLKASVKAHVDQDTVDSFTVSHQAGAKLSSPEIRTRIEGIVSDLLPGQWRAAFDLPTDTIVFSRRPPLPTMVRRPTDPVGEDQLTKIPQAVDEDGNLCFWDLGGVMAHQLKAGRTRTGKTVSLIGDAIEGARRGFRIFILDPKRIEFLGLRTWPNVQLVATSVPDQIVLVNHWHEEMMERYRLIEEEGARKQDFERVMIVIDEYRQFHDLVQSWWKSVKVSGMPSTCPVFDQIGSMLRLAAAARIHIVLGTQRPDAEFLGGEVRDNFSSRAATGALSPDGARMMFDTVHVGTRIPRGLQGRGTWAGDGRPKEVQYLYTPDPHTAHSAEDKALLEALRPETVSWPRQRVAYPSDSELAALMEGVKASPDWVRVQNAHLEDMETVQGFVEPVEEQQESTTELEIVNAGEQDPDWATAQMTAVGQLTNGDLAELDGIWGTVQDIVPDPESPEQVLINWLSAETDDETVISSSIEECVLARAAVY